MNDENSLSDEATLAAASKRRADLSLGDERTLGGGERSGADTALDDIEVVDLESRYKPEGTLGQGGMGAVLLATDTRLGRKVAIKRILGEAAGNRMAVQRFLTEAKAIAALNHPNVVQIYDYGRAKDGPFLIMEYVDGGSLLERCRESALPLEEAIELACQLCDGLAKAHDLGIIHRDIKPANVLLTKDGTPKLTDFGLAKSHTGDRGQTIAGAVLGTPDFMPPEQRRDTAEVDERSDLWSLAATVYQMVTGRSPKIIRFNDVPAMLQDVLSKALEDKKEARYQRAREFRDAIKASLRTAVSAATVGGLGEGHCPACGAKNDLSRKFCRGCGDPLEAACLSCATLVPLWEEICGSCGARQTPIAESRRAEMAAIQSEAEGLLGEYAFAQATNLAMRLRDESHPRLSKFKPWAESFLGEVRRLRNYQVERAIESLAKATMHEAAYDYMAAVKVLESIPDAILPILPPVAGESVTTALVRIGQKHAESLRLEALVRKQIAAKSVEDLLPDVNRLLSLHPHRQDLRELQQQLLEVNKKQAAARAEAIAALRQEQNAARDKAVSAARACLASHDYGSALAALSSVAAEAISPEVQTLREQARGLLQKVQLLLQTIKRRVTAKDLDGLLSTVELYLTLTPADCQIQKLRQSLMQREKQIATERAKQAEMQVAAVLGQILKSFDDCVDSQNILAVFAVCLCTPLALFFSDGVTPWRIIVGPFAFLHLLFRLTLNRTVTKINRRFPSGRLEREAVLRLLPQILGSKLSHTCLGRSLRRVGLPCDKEKRTSLF